MPKGREKGQLTTHLYRGSAAVRSWSKYQKTEREWSLCGIQRIQYADSEPLRATEKLRDTNCPHCRELAGASPVECPAFGLNLFPVASEKG